MMPPMGESGEKGDSNHCRSQTNRQLINMFTDVMLTPLSTTAENLGALFHTQPLKKEITLLLLYSGNCRGCLGNEVEFLTLCISVFGDLQ